MKKTEKALFDAISKNEYEMAKNVIDKRTNINVKNKYGDTPLIHAIKNGADAGFVSFLISCGADVNLHGVDNGYVRYVTMSLSPLHFAIENQSLEVVKVLLDAGANVNINECPNSFSQTPLMEAIETQNAVLVQMLLDKGANPEDSGITHSPLSLAIDIIKEDDTRHRIVNSLIQAGADVNKPSGGGLLPLMYASLKGYPQDVKTLLSHGADVNLISAHVATSALLISLDFKSSHDVVSMLLDAGADISVPEKRSGKTALMMASAMSPESDALYFTKRIASLGGDIRAFNNDGFSAFTTAVSAGNFEVARWLLENGEDINRKNNQGLTPIMRFSSMLTWQYSQDDYDREVDRITSTLSFLLDNGADVNDTDTNGITPFLFFSQTMNTDIMRFLLDKGADPYHTAHDGHTVLDMVTDGFVYRNFCHSHMARTMSFLNSFDIFNDNKALDRAAEKLHKKKNSRYESNDIGRGLYALFLLSFIFPAEHELLEQKIAENRSGVVRAVLELYRDGKLYIQPEKVLSIFLRGKRSPVSLDNTYAEILISMMIDVSERNPDVVYNFINFRVGKKQIKEFNEQNIPGSVMLLARLVHYVKQNIKNNTSDEKEQNDINTIDFMDF